MPLLFIVGMAALILGLILFFAWLGHIIVVIKALLPGAFIVGGAVAAYLGWEEMKEAKGPHIDFASPEEADRYKTEARAYQAEINQVVVEASAVETVTVDAAAQAGEPQSETEKDNK